MNTYLIVLASAGILNAGYLYRQYRKHQATGAPMVCLFGKDCGVVVASKYGKTFGVKNELWGVVYYLSLIVLSFIVPATFGSRIVAFAAFAAAAFSSYLLYLQLFVLRKYCSWCLMAIAINFAILALALL